MLHERRGGWADAMRTVRHLADRARSAGTRIEEGVEVTGFELGSGRVDAVLTSRGPVGCEIAVLAPGPWAGQIWAMLGQNAEIEVASAEARDRRPLIAYWKAQEGEFQLAGAGAVGRSGHDPPVVHLDQSAPLRSDRDGEDIAPGPWGIYFRIDREGTRSPAAACPCCSRIPTWIPTAPTTPPTRPTRLRRVLHLRPRDGDRALPWPLRRLAHDPRRRDRLAHARQLSGLRLGAPNAYAIIDSGHGFKLLALGRLAADDVLAGEPRLEPFRLDRFARGETHTPSRGPYPWT